MKEGVRTVAVDPAVIAAQSAANIDSEFQGFPKIARLSREVIITEKIDGTNAQVWISDDGSEIKAGSRSRWITPSDDNFGFARWVEDNRADLLTLGPGRHFGEWWGSGIQRNYSQTRKRFSLFNVSRWGEERPLCCEVVPVLYRGEFTQSAWIEALTDLRKSGSRAAPGFMKPEGIVIFHVAANVGFKKTLEKDEEPKSHGHVRSEATITAASQPSDMNP